MEIQLYSWIKRLGWPAGRRLLAMLVFLPAPNDAGSRYALWWAGLGMALLGLLLWLARASRRNRAARLQAQGLAAAAPTPAQLEQLILQLGVRSERKAAADALVALGDVCVPLLTTAFAKEIEEQCLRSLAQVCERLNTPAVRQLLFTVVQTDNLAARNAALRALSSYASVPADAPVFHRLVEEEMQFAQHLLHGIATIDQDNELQPALRYELGTSRQRLFGLLLQLYDRPLLLDVQRALAHPAADHQRAALALLEELIPRPLLRGLQALLDASLLSDQLQAFEDLLGPVTAIEPVPTTVVRRGAAAFTPWTIGLALRQWHPQPATVALLHPQLYAANPLIRESALAVLRRLPMQRPAAYDQLLTLYPAIAELLMNPTIAPFTSISAQARVKLLKGTALFAQTPENVLDTIVPIMHEVSFESGQEIFAKGHLGTSLFILCAGEVGVFNGKQLLATFGTGDFFGELALLDAEPRSATAMAQSAVTAFRLDQEDFYEVMGERSEVLRSILKVLCYRLRKQNEQAAVAK